MPSETSDSERIRALIEEVDRVCAEARLQSQRLSGEMGRAPVWPERRPRRWTSSDYGPGCEEDEG